MPITFILHDEIFQEHMALLTERLATLEEPLKDIGHIVQQYIDANFASAEWPPLSENTVRLKAALGYPPDPLIRTGAMYQEAVYGQWEVSGGGRSWRAKLPVPGYSNFHFTGTVFMPKRDYAILEDSIEGYVSAILEAHLFAGLIG